MYKFKKINAYTTVEAQQVAAVQIEQEFPKTINVILKSGNMVSADADTEEDAFDFLQYFTHKLE